MTSHIPEDARDPRPLIGGISIGLVAIGVAAILLTAPIANRAVLALVYLLLFVLTTVALHLVFVLDPLRGGIRYSTRAPKYLEYLYILTVMGALSQIAIASPKLAEYFQDETQLRLLAQADAKKELASCVKHKGEQSADVIYFYTDEFCKKLRRLAEAPENALAGVIDDLTKDDAFRSFIVGMVTTPESNRGPTKVMSSVAQDINRIVALRAIREDAQVKRSNPFEWIGLVLLPIGLALRITKTSMELFVDLVRPVPTRPSAQ